MTKMLVLVLASYACGAAPKPAVEAPMNTDDEQVVRAHVDAGPDALPAGTHVEDGVLVRESAAGFWCTRDGRPNRLSSPIGLCFEAESECAAFASDGEQCDPTDAVACYQLTDRTSGRKPIICLTSYANCLKARTASSRSENVGPDLIDCWIARRTP